MSRPRAESEWAKMRRLQEEAGLDPVENPGATPRSARSGGGIEESSPLSAADITFDEPEFTPRGTPRVVDAAYLRRKVQTIKKRIGEGVALKKKRGELKKEFAVLAKKEAEAQKLAVLAEKLEEDPSGLRRLTQKALPFTPFPQRQELQTVERKTAAQLEAAPRPLPSPLASRRCAPSRPRPQPHRVCPKPSPLQALDAEIQKIARLRELKAHGKLAKSLRKLVTGGASAAAKRASAHAAATWQDVIDGEVASLEDEEARLGEYADRMVNQDGPASVVPTVEDGHKGCFSFLASLGLGKRFGGGGLTTGTPSSGEASRGGLEGTSAAGGGETVGSRGGEEDEDGGWEGCVKRIKAAQARLGRGLAAMRDASLELRGRLESVSNEASNSPEAVFLLAELVKASAQLGGLGLLTAQRSPAAADASDDSPESSPRTTAGRRRGASFGGGELGTAHASVLCEQAEDLAAYAEADTAAVMAIVTLPAWEDGGGGGGGTAGTAELEATVAQKWIELDLGGAQGALAELQEKRARCAAKLQEYQEERELPEGPSVDPSKVAAAQERLRAEREQRDVANRQRREDLERSWTRLVAETGCDTVEEWTAAEENLRALLDKAQSDLARQEEKELEQRSRGAAGALLPE